MTANVFHGRRCALRHRVPVMALTGAHLCQAHSDGVLLLLGRIRDHHALLAYEDALPRGKEAGNPDGKRPARPHSPAPIRLDVLAMLDPRTGPMLEPGDLPNVAYELGIWTDIVRDSRGLSWAPLDVDGRVRLLRAHHGWLIAQEWAGDYRDHLRAIAGKVDRAVGQAPPAPFAHCIALTDRGDCGGPLRMDGGGTPMAVCPRCDRVYMGADLIRLKVIASREGHPSGPALQGLTGGP